MRETFNLASKVVTGAVPTIAGVIGSSVDFTVTTAGAAIVYTAAAAGAIVTKTAAAGAMILGYPIAIVSGVTALATGYMGTGPCTAYATLPDMTTLTGFSQIVFSPTVATVQATDAALCPAAASTCVGATALAITSYVVARLAKGAFA